MSFTPSLTVAQNATVDDLRFIFSQAEKRVKETADEGDRLNTKSITIIGVCLTFLTALVGFIYDDLAFSPIILSSFYVGYMLWHVCDGLKPNIQPVDYISIGSYPSTLLIDEMYTNLQGKTPEWYLLFAEILAYEERIEINNRHNQARNLRLESAYRKLSQLPLWFIVCLLITSLLFRLFNLP